MSDETLTAESLLERLRSDGVNRVGAAFRKPPIPSRILQELTTMPDAPEALDFVAAYPLSPSHLLETLADSNPASSVLAHLAANPRTPPHLLIRFAAHEDPTVRAQAATHPQLPSREVLTLVGNTSAEVRRAVAGSASLRLPHQAALVIDDDSAVRLRLTSQAALPAPVALVLGADDCAVVRLHVIATATVEDDVLEGWAASEDEDVQLALLQRSNMPVEIYHLMVLSPHPAVRRIARTDLDLDDPDLLFLMTHGEIDERAWVASRPLLHRSLQSLLARDAAEEVRKALAANSALDAVIARYFVTLAEEPVCAALALNPALPVDLIEELAATRLPTVLTGLAYRDDLDEKLVTFLIEHSAEFRGHWAMQERVSVALSPEMAQQLGADPLPTVRRLALRACPDWRRADLYDMARDPVASVRLAVLHHPNAPDGLVEDAVDDPDEAVAATAREIQRNRLAAGSTVTAASKISQRDVDVPPAGSTLSGPARTAEPDHSPSRAPAPDILNKLKRIFWQ
ncbi:hypothetical protein [Synoicihabitans lomoniglobus]|uniref:Leucine rich repeat variant n=1 Tax=Synoicihabitans lomoniglobus TaxID=2909285 RepID=A0AAF0A0C2_9BACT|nr:hypothetical protein [Opitutaceae bacterium LMO-M01]WED64147.1 hypothetical protein PXH66_17555 [Opitutaceae bacterium LMO-M01]